MNLNDYQQAAKKTAIYDKVYKVIYTTLGLAGEAGEIANKVKKMIRDGDGRLTPELRQILIDELGDVLWYVAMLASDLDINLDDVGNHNIQKLLDRQQRNMISGSGDTR